MLGAGREGGVEKGQAGLRRSQLKMQVCGCGVFWSLGPREGRGVKWSRGRGDGREFSTLEGRRMETSGSPTVEGQAADRGLLLPLKPSSC